MAQLPPLIDAHAHLIWPDLESDLDNIMERAKMDNIQHIINTGIKYSDFEPCLAIQQRFPQIQNIIGIHPGNIGHSEIDFNAFAEKFSHYRTKFQAIGEIGMDFLEEKIPDRRKAQENLFRKQLELAQSLQKPIVIHCRWAEKHCIEILEELQFTDIPKVLMHCFVAAEKYVKKCLVHDNWFFTVPTSVCIKSMNQKMVELVPLEKIMVETDAPFLSPDPNTKLNEPYFVRWAARKIATMKSVSEEIAAEIMTKTTKIFFNIQ